MRRVIAAPGLVLAALGPGWSALAQVVLRPAGAGSPLSVLDGTVKSVALEGVVVRVEGGDKVVGWDRVKLVEGPLDQEAAAFADEMDAAWRARIRLERGDIGGAEPLLEKMFEQFSSFKPFARWSGPTAAVVAEGLLRCRLARGAKTASVVPWLRWLEVMERSGGVGKVAGGGERSAWVGGRIALEPVADDETGLVPLLPPVWVPGPSLVALAGSSDWGVLKSTAGLTGALAELYEAAAKFEVGGQIVVGPAPSEGPRGAGVRLVYDMVVARCGSQDERAAARERLRSRLVPAGRKAAPAPRWVEVWCRTGIGRSLLRESSEADQLMGVVELLHVPARFGGEEPDLAALALAEASDTLAKLDDIAGAAALRSELASQFARHPAVEWVRTMAAPTETTPEGR